jgi:hypothetical protein
VHGDRLPQDRSKSAGRVFEDRVAEIFQRLPALGGFHVQHDLKIRELTLHTWPGADSSQAVAKELSRVLDEMVEEQPDAADWLRGRTFARSFQ